MIKLSRINKEEFYVNPSLIETMEQTPDTVLTLINGKKYIVKESPETIVTIINEYYRVINTTMPKILLSEYGRGAENK